jgi:hypothetical protein
VEIHLVCLHKEDTMTSKIFVVVCLLGLMVAPNMASAATMSRGECANAVKEKLGNPGIHRSEIRAAIQRCVEHGPDAILDENARRPY